MDGISQEQVTAIEDEWQPEPLCPACGEPIDYCQGHGEIGDPAGAYTLRMHDSGNHRHCHAGAECDEAQD